MCTLVHIQTANPSPPQKHTSLGTIGKVEYHSHPSHNPRKWLKPLGFFRHRTPCIAARTAHAECSTSIGKRIARYCQTPTNSTEISAEIVITIASAPSMPITKT